MPSADPEDQGDELDRNGEPSETDWSCMVLLMFLGICAGATVAVILLST